MRTASVSRDTKETRISVEINLDGTGAYDVQTGVGFFDHMLEQLSRHSLIDMKVRAEGDTHIDFHHTVEDTVIALGQAISSALGDLAGITRYADRSDGWSALVGKFLRVNGLRETPRHTPYSLRHYCEDELKRAGVDYEVRKHLFGHKIDLPEYGQTPLEVSRDALERIAL